MLPLGKACEPGDHVREGSEPDKDPLAAREAFSVEVRDDVHDRRPREERDPDRRPEPVVPEHFLDAIAEEPHRTEDEPRHGERCEERKAHAPKVSRETRIVKGDSRSAAALACCGAVDEHDLADDPIVQLEAWLAEARAACPQADAMTLATADLQGRPSARQVLLRGLDARGLVFFTNRTSRKAEELAGNPRAALVFHWWELGRQVRVEGSVEEVGSAESDVYWSTRPRASRLAAWASPQSHPIADRGELDRLYAEAEGKFGAAPVTLPPFWGGYRVVPDSIEFWLHRDDRLHDRVRYRRSDSGWLRERLAP